MFIYILFICRYVTIIYFTTIYYLLIRKLLSVALASVESTVQHNQVYLKAR